MNKALTYFRYRLPLFVFYGIAVFFTLLIPYLAGQDMAYARYTVLLLTFFLLLLVVIDALAYFRRLEALRALSVTLMTSAREWPEAANAVEAELIRFVRELGDAYDDARRKLATEHDDSLEYYTLWVHQIKTPIAALQLILSQEAELHPGMLRQELFKIEQYADLALRYVKLSDIASDLILEPCHLQEIVRESVKKFALLFVYRKLSVEIVPMDDTVITDRRWLAFILEQILSNAIKYTPSGGIRLYKQGSFLTVEDTGIGIRPEDLPRVFSKGYTGYNGRIDQRASGIGLYLVKKAASALGLAVDIQSEVGVGTKVSLLFPDLRTDIYR